ncbi:hypothetical protein JCM8097_007292 [Rhodosporidiobolus ruineniae]
MALHRTSTIRSRDSDSHSYSPPSPVPSRPPMVLLAAYSVDRDLARAALDTLQRLTSKDRAARKRSRMSSPLPSSSSEDEPSSPRNRRKIDLHVLLLPSSSAVTVEAQDEVLEELDAIGMHVHVHPLAPPSNRISYVGSSPARAALLQACGADGPYESILREEISAAGFVFGQQPCEGNDASRTFVEILAKHASSAFPTTNSPPSLTLYVASRPTSSDFDLDLPADQILSLRVLNSAAETFKSASPLPPSASKRHSRSLSWQPDFLSAPSSPPRPPSSPLPSFLAPPTSSPPSSTAFKSLALRPAPSPVQSVALRLSCTTSDLFFRVSENLTPVDNATGKRFDGTVAAAQAAQLDTPLSSAPPSPRPKMPARGPARAGRRLEPTFSMAARKAGEIHRAPLLGKPPKRSDTTLTTSEVLFDSQPELGELRGLLKERQDRAAAARATMVAA